MRSVAFFARLLLALFPCTGLAFNRPVGGPRLQSDRRATEAPPSTFMREVAELTQHGVAQLFNFEHARAAKFERFGHHEYWADPRIHNFGNLGWRGLLHALVVPAATHAIDRFAYDGVDARKVIHESEFPADKDVTDLCCGVGFSPARNGRVTAVDTSTEMLTIARLRRPDVKRFEKGNAENWGEVRAAAARASRPRIPHMRRLRRRARADLHAMCPRRPPAASPVAPCASRPSGPVDRHRDGHVWLP